MIAPFRSLVFDPMRATKGPIHEYACHEVNHALPGILRGARVQEKAQAGAQGGVQ